MLSISSGLISATGLPRSVEPVPPSTVTLVSPGSFSIIIPSITNTGCEFSVSELVPRMTMRALPLLVPGGVMVTPATLPEREDIRLPLLFSAKASAFTLCRE